MTLQIIQVGLGGWGKDWARDVVAKNKDVETTAWVEIDAATLQEAQQRLKLPVERCFTSLDEALTTVSADAVLVTASLPGHVPSARTALQAGKHVLMEKPFAPTVAEAHELVELAARQECLLMISQNYRFFPAPRAVARLIQQQAIGRVGNVNIDFRRYDNLAPVETHRHYHIWEPLLVDMSIHHFDLMRLVIGQEPVQVFCKTWNAPWSKYDEPAEGAMTITFDGGAVVNYRGSWVSTGPQTNWAGEWHVEGEKGELVWTSRGETQETASIQLLGEEKPTPIDILEIGPLDRAGSLAAFVHAIQTNTNPETSGEANLKTLALMFAAVESARTGLPVNIA
ncbi:Gfo/Idh/MocA family protein [Dictyobacter arantiisoli]|uniref:Oxidoreductase n=1 Tax=Dictyobacter arantiisoli TaxID=2014874 RepID=A0A5A5TGN0_9CHLR|nr:Gfo/Idh/MocA family oxidoreductase [Dictyobacter arantiisoli]GCF10517.1 oxidoreductase [Dictyobacter arantiisoli]